MNDSAKNAHRDFSTQKPNCFSTLMSFIYSVEAAFRVQYRLFVVFHWILFLLSGFLKLIFRVCANFKNARELWNVVFEMFQMMKKVGNIKNTTKPKK